MIAKSTLLAVVSLFLPPVLCTAVEAQIPTVVYGRIEDSITRDPVVGAQLFSADSTRHQDTDSEGEFAVQLPPDAELVIRVERQGYQTQSFALPENAAERITVLLIEPNPIEIVGVEAVTESRMQELMSALTQRRNAFGGAVRVMERDEIARFANFATMWEFIRARLPITECGKPPSGLCVPGRVVPFDRNYREPMTPFDDPIPGRPQEPVPICVDGRLSTDSETELKSLDRDNVAMLEIFDRGRHVIRFYTPEYLQTLARAGVAVLPRPAFNGRGYSDRC